MTLEKYEDECDNFSIRQKIKFHYDVHVMKNTIHAKTNILFNKIVFTRHKICKSFHELSMGLIKFFHSMTKFESLDYKCPSCGENINCSHIFTHVMSIDEKVDIMKSVEDMLTREKVNENLAKHITECAKVTLGIDVNYNGDNPQCEINKNY